MKILHLLSGGSIGGIEMLCLNIAQLSLDRHEFCFLYSGGVIADEMKREKIPVYLYYKKRFPIRMLKLWKLVKKEQYDIVVVHHEGIGIYSFYLMLVHYFRNVKFIKYLHCSFEEKYFYEGNKLKDWLNYRILKSALLKSDCGIAVSNFVKKSYCEAFNYDTDYVKVVYNGIKFADNDEVLCKEKTQGENIGLLYIGRLVEVKGVHLLLQAVQRLVQAGENVYLEILGDGPEREKYEQLARELEIEDKVCFEGHQLQKQSFYNKSQIFIYPSIWQEAFGISIVEALAQGMICVASKTGGIPEIIEDGENGFLFANGNVNELTEILLKAIACCKDVRYQEKVALARRKAREFDINNTIDDLQDICQHLVEK